MNEASSLEQRLSSGELLILDGAGVQIVGGCCGIGPAHIQALHQGLR